MTLVTDTSHCLLSDSSITNSRYLKLKLKLDKITPQANLRFLVLQNFAFQILEVDGELPAGHEKNGQID